MAELEPISLTQTAMIVGYALFCSLVVNDFVKATLIRRIQRAPNPSNG